MSVKKSSKQKNTRHHITTTTSIVKKQSTKAKLRNQDLRTRLDKTTGLAGAANLFAPSKLPKTEETKTTEKTVEEDISALISMKLSTKAQ
jgi:hypothetical protein